MSTRRTVAVTGAGGFLGQYFVRKLLESGYAVRALSSRQLPARVGLEPVRLNDLCDVDGLVGALRGADAVIHLAGLAHVAGSTDTPAAAHAFHRANALCVEAVCRAARRAELGCVVLMSSAAVVGEPGDVIVSASTPAHPSSPYGQSKLEGEAYARHELAGSVVRLRIFRPPLVHGPGMRGNPLRLFSLVDRGIPLPLGGIRNRRSVISAHNLFDAVDRSIRSDVSISDPLYVSDDIAPSTPELVLAIGRALHRRVRLIPVPGMLLHGVSAVTERRSAALPSWLSRSADDLRRLTSSFVVDQSIARETFGFVPRLSLQEGLDEAAEWWTNRKESRKR
jgi:nucleoside-diphosphate-sugar epimerase